MWLLKFWKIYIRYIIDMEKFLNDLIKQEEFYKAVMTAWYQHEFPEDLEEEIEWIIKKYEEKEL